MSDLTRSFFGIALLIFIGWLFSLRKKNVNWRIVLSALALQMGIGAMVLFSTVGSNVLKAIAETVTSILKFGSKGTEFLFGNMVTGVAFVRPFVFDTLSPQKINIHGQLKFYAIVCSQSN